MRKNYVKKEPKFKEIKRSLDAFYTFAIKIYKYVTRVNILLQSETFDLQFQIF